jgi:hypothetical protein
LHNAKRSTAKLQISGDTDDTFQSTLENPQGIFPIIYPYSWEAADSASHSSCPCSLAPYCAALPPKPLLLAYLIDLEEHPDCQLLRLIRVVASSEATHLESYGPTSMASSLVHLSIVLARCYVGAEHQAHSSAQHRMFPRMFVDSSHTRSAK